MTVFTAPTPQVRPCEWRLLWNGLAIEITVERRRGKRTGTVTTLYRILRVAADMVYLVKDNGDNTETKYLVTRYNCECKDNQFAGGRGICCKHRSAVLAAGLLGTVAAGGEDADAVKNLGGPHHGGA